MEMWTRTTQASVTFSRSFSLSSVDGTQPAGTYRVVTNEKQVQGLVVTGLQRTATMLHLPASPAAGVKRYVVLVNPKELADALAEDAAWQTERCNGNDGSAGIWLSQQRPR